MATATPSSSLVGSTGRPNAQRSGSALPITNPSPAAGPAVDHGIRPPFASRAHGLARGLPRQQPPAQDLPVFEDQRPVVEDEVETAADRVRHAPRGGVAPPGDEDQVRAIGAGLIEGGERAGGDRLVAAEERAVDVEGEQAERGPAHGPVQISTRSMTSPGRIL